MASKIVSDFKVTFCDGRENLAVTFYITMAERSPSIARSSFETTKMSMIRKILKGGAIILLFLLSNL